MRNPGPTTDTGDDFGRNPSTASIGARYTLPLPLRMLLMLSCHSLSSIFLPGGVVVKPRIEVK